MKERGGEGGKDCDGTHGSSCVVSLKGVLLSDTRR